MRPELDMAVNTWDRNLPPSASVSDTSASVSSTDGDMHIPHMIGQIIPVGAYYLYCMNLGHLRVRHSGMRCIYDSS